MKIAVPICALFIILNFSPTYAQTNNSNRKEFPIAINQGVSDDGIFPFGENGLLLEEKVSNGSIFHWYDKNLDLIDSKKIENEKDKEINNFYFLGHNKRYVFENGIVQYYISKSNQKKYTINKISVDPLEVSTYKGEFPSNYNIRYFFFNSKENTANFLLFTVGKYSLYTHNLSNNSTNISDINIWPDNQYTDTERVKYDSTSNELLIISKSRKLKNKKDYHFTSYNVKNKKHIDIALDDSFYKNRDFLINRINNNIIITGTFSSIDHHEADINGIFVTVLNDTSIVSKSYIQFKDLSIAKNENTDQGQFRFHFNDHFSLPSFIIKPITKCPDGFLLMGQSTLFQEIVLLKFNNLGELIWDKSMVKSNNNFIANIDYNTHLHLKKDEIQIIGLYDEYADIKLIDLDGEEINFERKVKVPELKLEKQEARFIRIYNWYDDVYLLCSMPKNMINSTFKNGQYVLILAYVQF